MAKNRVEVVINGSILSLQGDASEEHMQKVAKLINEKLSEIQGAYDKTHLPAGKLNQLLTLNLADECVKKQEMINRYAAALETTGQSNAELKEQLGKLTSETESMKQEMAAYMQHKKAHTNRGR